MIREDRELARVNTDVMPVAMRLMDDRATAEEQRELAGRLIDLGQRLCERAGRTSTVVEGRVVAEVAHATSPPLRSQEQ